MKKAQNEGHEKATEKPRKTPKHCFSKEMRATKKPRKSDGKVTSKNVTSNEKSSEITVPLPLPFLILQEYKRKEFRPQWYFKIIRQNYVC